MTPARRWIGAWVLCGLALRIAFALFYWVGQPLTHDEREYLAIARSVAHGGGFTYPSDEPEPGTAQQHAEHRLDRCGEMGRDLGLCGGGGRYRCDRHVIRLAAERDNRTLESP